MSDAVDILNTPVVFKINNKDYKVRRASLKDLVPNFEVEVKGEYIANANKISENIKDEDKRNKFLIKALKEIPQGLELSDMVQQKMASIDGYVKVLFAALKNDNTVTIDDVRKMAMESTIDTNMVFNYTLGSDLEKEGKVSPDQTPVTV